MLTESHSNGSNSTQQSFREINVALNLSMENSLVSQNLRTKTILTGNNFTHLDFPH